LTLVLFLGNGFKCCSKRQKQDIIDYTEIEDEEGAIIFLDQQKAFDRAEWEWIDFCLENVKYIPTVLSKFILAPDAFS
jgi:hypothetical protein